ncbi:MFS transporter [Mucilaginibacter sp. UR6-1]|uniref:MFS transporter n=1 Tax=Mucilaginibacter sp. UR6-1 TaxID=1435643 RepID=UPI001E61CA70|nr:MFS transporter [Mucilaginibacter sp. UR6-1]MCC8409773.1 MFS transporter [Mucilaginibacter sp. UR6-1]
MMTDNNTKPTLTPALTWLMAIGAGMVVANNYYNQPLLAKIAAEFKVTEAKASLIAMLTQIGYATGLLLIIPLGDMLRRKKLILVDFIFIVIALLAAGWAGSIHMLMVASFFIGLTSVIPQLFVPLAAQLARPEESGKAIGTVVSGLLIGVLTSRTVSGFVGEHYGWRAIFFIAAGLMVLLWIALLIKLPDIRPQFSGTYGSLMRSLVRFVRTEPALRLAAARGMLAFASFSAFWTTLVFLLEGPPFFKGADVSGAFGIIGAGGAIAASVVGRLTDKVSRSFIITITLGMMAVSWLIFGVYGYYFIGLIVGVILLDLGLQAMHITNQAIIFALHPEARNRLNTVYMVCYFIGGALGTWLGGLCWQNWKWMGVSVLGGVLVLAALLLHFAFGREKVRNLS